MVDNSGILRGYKKTELGVFPEEWEIINLKDSSTLKARIGWQGLTTKEYLNTGEYFLITGTDFKDGKIDWNNCYYVDKKRFMQDRNIQIKPGDVLVTKDGTIGKVAYIDNLPKKATLNSGVFVIRSKGAIYHPKYFYYILMSNVFKDFLNKLSAGSTITHLYQKDFINFKFQIPSLREQRAIAELLSDIDALIASLEKMINKKRKIRQGTLQLLITGKKRLPGFTCDWEVKKLENLVEFTNGKAHENSISDNGKYIVVNSKFISTEGKVVKHSDDCFCLASKGDILMVMSDLPNGKALAKCYYVDQDNKYTANQRVCLLKPQTVDPVFLFYKINRNPYYLLFDDGVNQTNLRKEDVLGLEIMVPKTVEEQQAIAQILVDLDIEIKALEEKLKKYKEVKQGMMQELLTGRKRLV